MSVAAYIIIPVIILGLLSAVSAYISLTGLSNVNKVSEKICEEQLKNITVLNEIHVRNERIQKLMLKLFLSGNKETMEQVWSDVEAVIEETDSFMEQLDGAFYDGELEEMFKSYCIHFSASIDDVNKLKELAYQAESAVSYANYSLAREVTRWSDILQEDIDEIVKANDKVTDEMKDRLNLVYSTSKLACIVILIITAAVIIFVIVTIIMAVITPLSRMNDGLALIINGINAKHGDLSKRISVNSSNEIGRVSANINEFIGRLGSIMRVIISNSKKLDNSINNVAREVGTANASACDISTAMEQLSDAMEGVAATAHEVNKKTVKANVKVNNMAEETDEILNYTREMNERAIVLEKTAVKNKEEAIHMVSVIVEELKNAMEESRQVEKVSQLTTDILSISSQTDLLSLNASIEAAKAGEAGRGFSVVAGEIRRLAECSSYAANTIQEINEVVVQSVDALIASSNKIVDFIDGTILPDYDTFVKSGQQYNEDATRINDTMQNFAELSKDLNDIIDSIVGSVHGITEAVEEGADGVTSAAASVDSLVADISNVNKEMEANREISNKFKEEADCFVNF